MFSMVALEDQEKDSQTALLVWERTNLVRFSSKLLEQAFEQVRGTTWKVTSREKKPLIVALSTCAGDPLPQSDAVLLGPSLRDWPAFHGIRLID